jgi:DNA-binding MarR family transcriptional regulator
MNRRERFVYSLAPTGNLFLLITLPELRREGLTYLAFYALQRAIEVADSSPPERYTEHWLRSETGLKDYETSRACALLGRSGLVRLSRAGEDARVRELTPTERGRKLLAKIISNAADRLWNGIGPAGRTRRFREVAAALKSANHVLHGPLQLSFFDREILKGARRIRVLGRL